MGAFICCNRYAHVTNIHFISFSEWLLYHGDLIKSSYFFCMIQKTRESIFFVISFIGIEIIWNFSTFGIWSFIVSDSCMNSRKKLNILCQHFFLCAWRTRLELQNK